MFVIILVGSICRVACHVFSISLADSLWGQKSILFGRRKWYINIISSLKTFIWIFFLLGIWWTWVAEVLLESTFSNTARGWSRYF
jgi:hypothetical protein